jgi:hypothetical protein
MSRAIQLIEKITHLSEIAYLGDHDEYGTKPYDQDAAEYRAPFADLQLPDKSGTLVSTPNRSHQIKTDKRKSHGEDKEGNKVQ